MSAISWVKSLALFEATSWTIICQNLGWHPKLWHGKIKWVPKWFELIWYSSLLTELFLKCLQMVARYRIWHCGSKKRKEKTISTNWLKMDWKKDLLPWHRYDIWSVTDTLVIYKRMYASAGEQPDQSRRRGLDMAAKKTPLTSRITVRTALTLEQNTSCLYRVWSRNTDYGAVLLSLSSFLSAYACPNKTSNMSNWHCEWSMCIQSYQRVSVHATTHFKTK